MDNLTVLGVFAHPDDEFSCVGTLANHADNGDNIHLLFLTKGEGTSKLPGSAAEIKAQRESQAEKAASVIGAKVHFLDIPDTKVQANRENADKVAVKIQEIRPDIIITWNKSFRTGTGHPDHRYTQDIVVDAITYARFDNEEVDVEPHRERISLYTIQHHGESTDDLIFVDVSEQYEKIEEYIEPYLVTFGDWDVSGHKKAMLRYFGDYVRTEYAEAFRKLTWRAGRKLLD